MQVLHREAWRRWPVEAWDLGREEPQLPPDTARPVLASSRSEPATASVTSLPAERSRHDASEDEIAGEDIAAGNGVPAPNLRPATLHPASRRTR
jgi:hypothetical protein